MALQSPEIIVCAQWAEKRLEGGATEQWGDKWEEDFTQGKGGKKARPEPLLHSIHLW